jgi:demethylmenaquinone methyltransferase/2-methoxy-6-polyprenyl-1,4-benzoquinol methylase
MFDAIAPRYDMVNRIMTFRLDVRWRRKAVDLLALARGATVARPRRGHGRPVRRPGDGRTPSAGVRPQLRDARRRPTVDMPRVQADILRLPLPTARSTGRRVASPCATWSTSRRSSSSSAASCVRVDGIALLDVGIPSNRLVRFGNGIYFGHVVPRIGALLSDGAAYRYLPKSVAYLPSPKTMIARLHDAGFSDAQHIPLSGGITQLLLGTRR